VHSRLVDVDGRRLCVTASGQVFRVVGDQELGLEPRAARAPTPKEREEARAPYESPTAKRTREMREKAEWLQVYEEARNARTREGD
jgi:hypothetical protein